MHLREKISYEAGMYIVTDLIGPYAMGNSRKRYAQVFKDLGTHFIWVRFLVDKTESLQAISEVLKDAKARSGTKARYLKTDGDGIFRSIEFKQMCERFSFIHLRSAPEDHNTNAEIEREKL